jgi:hypothetical protein
MKDTQSDVVMEYQGGIFTVKDMYDLVKKEITKRYLTYPGLKLDYSIDDLTNEVMVNYYSKMKSTGEIRLHYYVKKYNGDIAHLKNLIKLSAVQQLNMALRNKHVKNRGYSLNNILTSVEDNIVEFQDLLVDDKIDLDRKFEEEDFINDLIKELDEYNKKEVYTIELNAGRVTSRLNFLINPHNLIKVAELNEKHRELIKDLIAGYPPKELRAKYKEYRYLMNGIKEIKEKRFKKTSTD